MHRFTTYLTHKVATHNMNTVIRITATIRPKGSACRGSLASEIFNFEIVRSQSSHLRFHIILMQLNHAYCNQSNFAYHDNRLHYTCDIY